jgi:hypothetical protein
MREREEKTINREKQHAKKRKIIYEREKNRHNGHVNEECD